VAGFSSRSGAGGVSVAALVGLKRHPWLATGWFWYLGTLVPVIGVGAKWAGKRWRIVTLYSTDRGFFYARFGRPADFLDHLAPGKVHAGDGGVLAAAASLVATKTR